MSHFGIGLKLQVSTRLEQKLVITPQLQQAIKLLQLNHTELAELLEEELLENPLLEVTAEEEGQGEELTIDTVNSESTEKETAPAEGEDSSVSDAQEAAAAELPDEAAADENPEDPFSEIDWEAYFEDVDLKTSTMPSNFGDFDPDLPSMESRLTPHTNLSEHLEFQLRLIRMSRDTQNMAVLIIGHLDHHGWLVIEDQEDEDPLDFLAEMITKEELKARGELPTPYEQRVKHWYDCGEEALSAIQGMEPYGVGARSLSECLLLQCRQIDNIEDPDLVERLIRDHLPELERRGFVKIGKQIKVHLLELLDAAAVIAQLDPYPSRAFQSEPAAYISPDIYIKKSGDDYTVTLNDDGLPKLKINAYYKKLLKDKDKAKREFVQEKLRDATWLLRSIQQRQQTIFKVTESIIERQRAFFDKGLQYLKPMILRDVAEDIEMHESTISRVTTNKYVHTPQGVFELKFFFTSSLQSAKGGEDVSSLTVKEKIRLLVAGEEPRSPLSDQQIVKILKGEGIKIARRTVAKYRSILNIPPSNQRKALF